MGDTFQASRIPGISFGQDRNMRNNATGFTISYREYVETLFEMRKKGCPIDEHAVDYVSLVLVEDYLYEKRNGHKKPPVDLFDMEQFNRYA